MAWHRGLELSDNCHSQRLTLIISLLLSTFITVFLAELGDKTQLATVALSGTTGRPVAVFVGSAAALVMASLLGAIAGGSIAEFVPTELLKLLASAGFLFIGARLLIPNLITESGLGAKKADDARNDG